MTICARDRIQSLSLTDSKRRPPITQASTQRCAQALLAAATFVRLRRTLFELQLVANGRRVGWGIVADRRSYSVWHVIAAAVGASAAPVAFDELQIETWSDSCGMWPGWCTATTSEVRVPSPDPALHDPVVPPPSSTVMKSQCELQSLDSPGPCSRSSCDPSSHFVGGCHLPSHLVCAHRPFVACPVSCRCRLVVRPRFFCVCSADVA